MKFCKAKPDDGKQCSRCGRYIIGSYAELVEDFKEVCTDVCRFCVSPRELEDNNIKKEQTR